MNSKQLWVLDGERPLSLLNRPIDKGWMALLESAGSYALEPYAWVRIHHLDDPGIAQVIENSREPDGHTLSELQSMFKGGAVTRHSGRLQDPTGIHTVWVNDRTLNASAVRLPAAYVIGIHVATPIILYRIFRELSKLPDFMPEIDGELARRYPVPLEFESFNPFELGSERSLQESMAWALALRPGNSYSTKRLLLTDLLTFWGMQIIITHEVGHVVAGHCDVLAAAGAGSWKERGNSFETLNVLGEFDTRRLWEIEADIVCANILSRYLTLDSYQHSFGKYFSALGLSFDLQTVIGLLNLVLGIVYTILGNLQPGPSAKATHPQFIGRMWVMEQTMWVNLKNQGVEQADARDHYLDRYLLSRSVALNAVPYTSMSGRENIEAVVREAVAEAETLRHALVANRGRWRDFSLVQQDFKSA